MKTGKKPGILTGLGKSRESKISGTHGKSVKINIVLKRFSGVRSLTE